MGFERFRPGAAYRTSVEEMQDNPRQLQAVHASGSCVVLAGPGSGKTKCVTTALARILTTEVMPPQNVACLTYNAECVRELTRRLNALGVQDDHNVLVSTVHGFCFGHVLLPYARLAGVDLPELITPVPDHILRDGMRRTVEKLYGPDDSFARAQRCTLHRRSIVDRRSSSWNAEESWVLKAIDLYERTLRIRGWVDFDDMVLMAARLIHEHAWIRRVLRAKFPVLFIDEYQDLGAPLHQIVCALHRDGVRLFAVGDPDQSILGFQGARPELLRGLARECGIQEVQLEFNYRSGETILRAAVMALGEERAYVSRAGRQGTIDFYHRALGLSDQAAFICDTLVPGALARETASSLGQIAIIYPTKAEGDTIAAAAGAAGFPFQRIDGGAPYRPTPFTRWLQDCAIWCSGGWLRAQPMLSTIAKGWGRVIHDNPSVEVRQEQRSDLIRTLLELREAAMPVGAWLSALEERFLALHLPRDLAHTAIWESLRTLRTAAGTSGAMANETVLAFGGQGGSPEHLNLITFHSAKGLEFNVVVLLGMDDGLLPSFRHKTDTLLQEARRLFYVGLTRAKHEVHLTYSGHTVNAYGRRFDYGPSPFLLELRERLQ